MLPSERGVERDDFWLNLSTQNGRFVSSKTQLGNLKVREAHFSLTTPSEPFFAVIETVASSNPQDEAACAVPAAASRSAEANDCKKRIFGRAVRSNSLRERKIKQGNRKGLDWLSWRRSFTLRADGQGRPLMSTLKLNEHLFSLLAEELRPMFGGMWPRPLKWGYVHTEVCVQIAYPYHLHSPSDRNSLPRRTWVYCLNTQASPLNFFVKKKKTGRKWLLSTFRT